MFGCFGSVVENNCAQGEKGHPRVCVARHNALLIA
jgi:hypothetical protein